MPTSYKGKIFQLSILILSLNKKIKFAVVGCGHIGKRHIAIIENNPDAELIAACDILSKEKIGLSNFTLPFFSSIDELLENSNDVDVVSIATPNGFHETDATKSIKADKHVLIEKPMALSKAACERIIYESLKHHKLVFCVMQNRYSPPSKWLKQIVEQKILGKIFLVEINCYWNRDERYYKPESWHGKKNLDGGTLFTQFSHFVDVMYWVFGEVTNIKSKFMNFNHAGLTEFEDSGVINFDFVNGGSGLFSFSTSVWNENLESSITIIGENGTVKIGGQYMNDLMICNIKDYQMPQLEESNKPLDYGGYKGSAANHQYVFQNIVDVLNNRVPISTNSLEGLKVVEIIERFYQSSLS